MHSSFFHPFLQPSLPLSILPPTRPSIHLSIRPSSLPSFFPFLQLFMPLSNHQFFHLPTHSSIHPPTRTSIPPPTHYPLFKPPTHSRIHPVIVVYPPTHVGTRLLTHSSLCPYFSQPALPRSPPPPSLTLGHPHAPLQVANEAQSLPCSAYVSVMITQHRKSRTAARWVFCRPRSSSLWPWPRSVQGQPASLDSFHPKSTSP